MHRTGKSIIRQRFMLIMACMGVMSLILFVILSLIKQVSEERVRIINELDILTKITSDLARVSPVLGDNRQAMNILYALSENQRIKLACIYDNTGGVFASFSHEDSQDGSSEKCFVQQMNRPEENDGIIYASQKITDRNNKKIGSILLLSDEGSIASIVKHNIIYAVVIILMLISASYFIASKLHRIIYGPMENLVNTMEKVGCNNSFAQRAESTGEDQATGELMKGFNDMMDRIEHYYSDLLKTIDDLNKIKYDAEKANDSKSMFLSNMSHELRTPMHAIISYSKICIDKIDKWDTKKIVESLQIINESGNRLLDIINSLLDLSKLEAGAYEFYFKENDIRQLILRVEGQIMPLLKEKNITLEVVDTDIDLIVECDGSAITQVVVNLLSNAIKFTGDNNTIKVKFEEDILVCAENTPALKVSVIDEGTGIPNDELETVFDKFVQSGKNTVSGGTGLGLPICRELISGHHGMISASNDIGDDGSVNGAIFTFVIPYKQSDMSVTAK